MPIEEPKPEDFSDLDRDSLPSDARGFFDTLQQATKRWSDAVGDKEARNQAMQEYINASGSLVRYIDSFIKNKDFANIKPEAMATIKAGLGEFFDWYNKFNDETEASNRGPDGLDGESISHGTKEIFDQIRQNFDPASYELGENGAFTRFLKGVGAKSTDFNKLAKKYLPKSKYRDFDNTMSAYTKLFEKIGKNINNVKDRDYSKVASPEEIRSLNKLSDDINSLFKEAEEKYNRDEQTKNPGKQKGNSTLSHLVKFFALLEILGAGIMAWWLIKQYCDNHSGCLKISYNAGASYVQNNKQYCIKGTLGPNYSTKTTYGPQLCYCSQFHSLSSYSANEDQNCVVNKNADQGNKFTPDNIAYYSGSKCNPPDGNISTLKLDGSVGFTYYSYIIMTPFDGLINIADKTADIVKNTLKDLINMIVHAVIILAIAGGVLLVLYIIYKVVANRKPAEAIKIETDSSKFGNILGNLNKFSRYNMRPISYAPVKFGNRFNF